MPEVEAALRQAHDRLPSAASRREFVRLAGLTAGALCTVGVLGACSDDDDPTGAGALTLDFARPIDVLRYAYALEALEADFYTRVTADAAFATTFASAAERQILTDLRDHEVAHREFLRAAIGAGGGAVPALTTQYPAAVSFSNRATVLATARTFEDLGVGAYNGAGRFLASEPALLTIAGKIVSVEARHASAIRDLIAPNTDQFANVTGLAGANEAQGLDALIRPGAVVAAAQPFVVQRITVTNATAA